MKATTYKVTLTGTSPLLMHKDNLEGSAMVKAWTKDPKNKANSVAGDDRSPAWTWITYLYHDGKRLVIDADNLMTMLRDGGKKCPAATGKGSMKTATQTGLLVNEIGWPLIVNGAEIPYAPLHALFQESDFSRHEEIAKAMGFQLFAKRARVATAKTVRVRARFDMWSASGTITVMDPKITKDMLKAILDQAGFYCGLCDWRPSSPTAPGQFGRFEATIEEVMK